MSLQESGNIRFTKSNDLIERLMESMIVNQNNCWVWQNAKDERGHGCITYRNKHYRAHRLSYKAFKGELVEGKTIVQTCKNKSCINPEHLKISDRRRIL